MTHRCRPVVSALLLWFVASWASGCSGGFLSTSYENTVAYFNTFYNAKKSYNEAVEDIRKNRPKEFQSNMFALPPVSQAARTKLLSVIEKCSKIIQFYPQSSLVDDALFLIGRSYYMMNEVLPARKKFSELLENFPTSEYRWRARLDLAKTEYIGQRESEALAAAKSATDEASAEEEWDIAEEGLLLEAQIFQDRRDFSQAIASCTKALELSADDGLLARAAFQCATCYEARGDIQLAGAAYERVLDFDPDFVLEYQARLKAATTRAGSGDYARALTFLEELSEEQLTPEERSRVELETGNVYRMEKEYDKALHYYDRVDSLYKRSDAAARSYYQRGLLYEQSLLDLRTAKEFYDKAKTEFPQSEITRPAARKAEILSRYLTHRSEFAKYDSLLYAAQHPELSLPVDSSKKADVDSALSKEKGLKSPAAQPKDSVSRRVAAAVPLDSIWDRRAASQFALGVLFFVDLERSDSAIFWLGSLLRDRPESRFAPQTLYVLAEIHRTLGNSALVDSFHNVLLAKYAGSEYARNVGGRSAKQVTAAEPDSLEPLYARAVRAMDSGNAEYALNQFKQIARSGTSRLSVKARYSVGWMYENIVPNRDSAIAYYRGLIADQPGSVYAQKVRPKIAFFDGKESSKGQPALPDTVKKSPVIPEGDTKSREPDPMRKKDVPPGEGKQPSDEKRDDPQ